MNLFKKQAVYEGYDKETGESQSIVMSKYNDEISYTFYSKQYIGKIFVNDKKGNENRPDLSYWKKDAISISVWFKKDKNGNNFLSTNIEILGTSEQATEQVRNNNFTNPSSSPTLDEVDNEDDIPF
jgi:hypothetical protein